MQKPELTVALTDAELLTLFREFDLNGDGYIDCAEFGRLLVALGHVSTPETLSLQFAAIDEDGDGKVTVKEFAVWWRD